MMLINMGTFLHSIQAPACFLDGLGLPVKGSRHEQKPSTLPINHTAVQGALFVAGCGELLPPTEALQLLPFLRAKSATMPLYSAMASNFLLEGELVGARHYFFSGEVASNQSQWRAFVFYLKL